MNAAPSFVEKATGCLAGVATGDALGRASEFMSREAIRARYGWLNRLVAPPDAHPAHAQPPGAVTDDTEQTLIVAHLLASGEPLTAERMAAALVEWAQSHDGLNNPYLGPSTRRALQALMSGASPHQTGRQGTTNGGAMRVAAVGIVHAGDFAGALRDAVAASIPTHNTHNAMQGAVAVAFAIAAAMQPGAIVEAVVSAAQEGARQGRAHGAWSWATPLDRRIALAVRLVDESADTERALDALHDFVGVGLDPAESVASAIGIVVAARGDPQRAIEAGANIGGDTDTIAAIAGSICGALRGIAALDAPLVSEVERVNGLDCAAIAGALKRRVPSQMGQN
ncbi:MAG: ADP-ribosylglycohydrolase family protein [Chloroflexi bacterium]|nr:ADP-ribosylglycohydrolase family protein [Chloroflexota bacterium]